MLSSHGAETYGLVISGFEDGHLLSSDLPNAL